MLRALDLESDIARLRRPEEDDPRKLAIIALKRKYPNVKGIAFAIAIDNAEIESLSSWVAASGGKRLWFELWQHPATRNAVRKYLSDVTSELPHKLGKARKQR